MVECYEVGGVIRSDRLSEMVITYYLVGRMGVEPKVLMTRPLLT